MSESAATRLLARVNEIRKTRGRTEEERRPLSLHDKMSGFCQKHAEWMADEHAKWLPRRKRLLISTEWFKYSLQQYHKNWKETIHFSQGKKDADLPSLEEKLDRLSEFEEGSGLLEILGARKHLAVGVVARKLEGGGTGRYACLRFR